MKATFFKSAAMCALLFLGIQTKALAEANAGAATPEPPAAPAGGNAVPVPVTPVESPATVSAPAVQPVPEVKPTSVEVPTGTPVIDIQSNENNTISISLDSVPVDTVVRMFAKAANANIVAASLPTTNVTVRLENVQWEPALTEILGSVGLSLVQHQVGIWTVVSKDDVAAEPVSSEIFFLNYSTSSNLLPMVERMVIGISNSTVSSFNGANAIIVRAPQSTLKQVREVLTKIDKQRDQVMIECKFVELNDQAIKDLGINWQSLQGWSVGLHTPQIAFNNTRTKQNAANHDNKTHYVEANAQGNATLNQNANGNTALNSLTANQQGQIGASGSSAFQNSTPGSASQTGNSSVNGSASSSTAGQQSQSQTQSQTAQNNTFGLNATGISSYSPLTGDYTFVPSKDNLTENINNNQSTIVNALSAVLSADTFQATLSALQQNTGVEVVSNPKIIVASGQTATIHVGTEEPNVTASQVPNGSGSLQTTYQLDSKTPFIDLGVQLHVTPVLNSSNTISLKLKPELSSKLSDLAVGSFGQTFPVIQTRVIETEFSVPSGHTVALGGLTQTTDNEVVKKIPILGDIPIIGTYLFRHTHKEKIQDEVIIFVTASSALPDSLAEVSGIPDEAKLIHRHLAKRVEEAAKAEELAQKKAPRGMLPK